MIKAVDDNDGSCSSASKSRGAEVQSAEDDVSPKSNSGYDDTGRGRKNSLKDFS